MREAQDGVRRVTGGVLGLRDLGGGARGGDVRGASALRPIRRPSRDRLFGAVQWALSLQRRRRRPRFRLHPNCSTIDLDFSAGMRAGAAALDEARLEGMLSRALDVSGRESGVVLRVHSARRQPLGEGKTFVTYTA